MTRIPQIEVILEPTENDRNWGFSPQYVKLQSKSYSIAVFPTGALWQFQGNGWIKYVLSLDTHILLHHQQWKENPYSFSSNNWQQTHTNSVYFPTSQDNNTFLTLVTISCVPPLNCYGSGVSVEGSREEAASNALKQLPKALEEDQGKQGWLKNLVPHF